ncbi:hypothetical protein EIN_146120 [Entamoeba invadens IP1]|uniref:Uncharacterized protein n=1 Tax=Entamoeba invadens IP1 TaxID=370355 RepID=L7FLT7_ENTIV|nr:hypothetical protein EIN_146120 [Entamoeba invadens IP1]ELP87618.1 hypothetical protein EIN_146120 [Entamoeba invadens IP1]|eukprot:XP_004254389.1 hypothetical protein EIN_146120 [Entamoeba invadens IP1]
MDKSHKVHTKQMTAKRSFDHLFKILVIGESGVGKTAIMQRYCENTFDPVYISTVGVDFNPKIVNCNDKVIKMQLWDTAGQERFRNITTSYYRGTQGVLIVFDMTDKFTFEKVITWFQDVMEHNMVESPVIYLVGNKLDLEGKYVINREMVEGLSRKLGGVKFFFCSAKNGEGVQELFSQMTVDILQRGELVKKHKEQDTIEIDEKPKKKGGCC